MSLFMQLLLEHTEIKNIDRKTIVSKIITMIKSILNKPEYNQLKKALRIGLKSSKLEKSIQNEFYNKTNSSIEIGTYRYENFDKRYYKNYYDDKIYDEILTSFNKIFHKFCKESIKNINSNLHISCKITNGEEMDKGEYQLLLKL